MSAGTRGVSRGPGAKSEVKAESEAEVAVDVDACEGVAPQDVVAEGEVAAGHVEVGDGYVVARLVGVVVRLVDVGEGDVVARHLDTGEGEVAERS